LKEAEKISNMPPNVGQIEFSKGTILTDEFVRLKVSAKDVDGDQLTFRWEADVGELRRYELPKWQPEDGTPPEPTKEQIESTKPNHMTWRTPSFASFVGSFLNATVMVEVSDGVNPPVIRSHEVRILKPTTRYECAPLTIFIGSDEPRYAKQLPLNSQLPSGRFGQTTESFGNRVETTYSMALQACFVGIAGTDVRINEFRLTFDGREKLDSKFNPNRVFPNNGRNMGIIRRSGQDVTFRMNHQIYEGIEKIRIPVVHLIISGHTVKITGKTRDGKYEYELLHRFQCRLELTIRWKGSWI
jgi:hypothetical protein